MRDDKVILLDVLCQAFYLVVDVLQNGSNGGQIDGKSYNEYFTFQRLPDGRIDCAFMWRTYGHAGYFDESAILRMYGKGKDAKTAARNIVFDCLRGELRENPDEFSELVEELKKRIDLISVSAEKFELLPSE